MKTKIVSLTAITVLLLLTGCGMNSRPGTQDKIGTIVRIGKVGVMHETWEAQIIRGGFNGGTGAQGQAFDFTIEDYEMAMLCKKYMEEGREVKITYRCEWIYSAFRSDSGGDFLVKVEPVATQTK